MLLAHLSIDKPEMIGLELLDHLLGFLDHKEKYLNQTLAGYFQKALNAILNKRGFDVRKSTSFLISVFA